MTIGPKLLICLVRMRLGLCTVRGRRVIHQSGAEEFAFIKDTLAVPNDFRHGVKPYFWFSRRGIVRCRI